MGRAELVPIAGAGRDRHSHVRTAPELKYGKSVQSYTQQLRRKRHSARPTYEHCQAGQAPLLGWLREFTMLSKETRCHELRSARVAAG